MSLRKSPARTAAFLAANRANAQKSTGPRTPEGKRNVALNAIRSGRRAGRLLDFLGAADEAWFARLEPPDPATLPPGFLPPPYNFAAHPYTRFFKQVGPDRRELLGIYRAIYAALGPDPARPEHLRSVRQFAVWAWRGRLQMSRSVESPAWRAANLAADGALPQPERLRIPVMSDRGRASRVTITVWIRRGRRRAGSARVEPGYDWQEGRMLHAGVTVTGSMRHPGLGYENLWDVPAGRAPRIVIPTKPQSPRKQTRFKIVIPDSKPVTEARRKALREVEQAWLPYLQALAERGSAAGDPVLSLCSMRVGAALAGRQGFGDEDLTGSRWTLRGSAPGGRAYDKILRSFLDDSSSGGLL